MLKLALNEKILLCKLYNKLNILDFKPLFKAINAWTDYTNHFF